MRKMSKRSSIGAALLVATAVAVAGCGGSKSSSPPPVTVTVAATTPVTTTTESTTLASTAEQTTTTTDSGTGAVTGAPKGCGDLVNFGQAFSKAIAASAASGGGGIGAEADAFKSFASHAPAEIRDELNIIADAIGKYAVALKGIDLKAGQTPTPEVIAKLQAAAKDINQPAVAAAGQKISTWVSTHCHA
jgi:hypothetical protein